MDTLGDRIKRYEKVTDFHLTPRSCVFIRVDGKAFHTYTRNCEKPFDNSIMTAMIEAAQYTIQQMSGFKAAYIQSDECTFMITDFTKYGTQGWFDYELNKIISITASAFTAGFNDAILGTKLGEEPLPLAMFDARAFVVPEDDAPNVFIWRQRDWERNSVQMLVRSLYSHKECDNKKIPELHDMIHAKGMNWAKLDDIYKNGTFIFHGWEGTDHRKFDYDFLRQKLAVERDEDE